ncbi:MAG TPA: NUDIX hydrolase [bacterium]|nr:NUDIX hydrolase [bacterium]
MDKGIIIHSLIINNGKLLILKRIKDTYEGGLWDLPGGTLEDGEDLSEGIKREVFEETGLKIKNPGLFYYSSNIDIKKNKQFITIIFIVELNNKNKFIKINTNEHSQFEWIIPKDIIKYQTVNYLKSCIKYYINKKHPILKIEK